MLKKKAKPNYKILGPKHGKNMKDIANTINSWSANDIDQFEKNEKLEISIQNQKLQITSEDVEIIADDVPGWEIANYGKITVALDVVIDPELKKKVLQEIL